MTWEWQSDLIQVERAGMAEAAERVFFQSLREQVKRLVRRYIRTSEDDVEDLTQECLIRVFNNLDRLRGSDNFEPWLRAVVRNTSITWLREQQRERDSETQTEIQVVETSIDYDIEEHLAVQEALSALEGDDQQILEMRYCMGMRYGEISKHLGTTEDCVRKRVNRALAKLRQHPIIRAIIQGVD